MPAKSKSKKTTVQTKKPNKIKEKVAPSTPAKFLVNWLEDASLEVLTPATTFAAGERQLEFAVRANHATAQQGDSVKLTLLLRAHIHVANQTIVISEIRHSAIINTLPSDYIMAQLFAELYPHARQSLANLLALFGHNPPLPDKLEASATKA